MFDLGYRNRMPRQSYSAASLARSTGHQNADRRQLGTPQTDRSPQHRGVQPYVAYAACGVLETAALNITDIDPTVRNSLLHLAQAIAKDVDEELGTASRPPPAADRGARPELGAR